MLEAFGNVKMKNKVGRIGETDLGVGRRLSGGKCGQNHFFDFVISGLYKLRAIYLSPPSSDWNAQVVELVDTHV